MDDLSLPAAGEGPDTPDGAGGDTGGGDTSGDVGAATIVAPQKAPQKAADKKRKGKGIPKWNVILWDSDDHSYEYVVLMLKELFGHTPEQGFILAQAVDKTGKAIVLTTTQEHAELKRDQIIAYGADKNMKNCKGSMHSTIESAD